MTSASDEDKRTVFCANLSDKVTESLLYELFLQGGPVERVSIPKTKEGKPRSFGFITYTHKTSVPYALNLFEGTKLFGRDLTIKVREQKTNNDQSNQESSVNNTNTNSYIANQQMQSLANVNQQFVLNSFFKTVNQLDIRSQNLPLPTNVDFNMLCNLGGQLLGAPINSGVGMYPSSNSSADRKSSNDSAYRKDRHNRHNFHQEKNDFRRSPNRRHNNKPYHKDGHNTNHRGSRSSYKRN